MRFKRSRGALEAWSATGWPRVNSEIKHCADKNVMRDVFENDQTQAVLFPISAASSARAPRRALRFRPASHHDDLAAAVEAHAPLQCAASGFSGVKVGRLIAH